MRPSQIIAIDRVRMEAPLPARDRLVWFYSEVVGLALRDDSADGACLRFHSAQLELHIDLVANPRVDVNRRKAVLSVRSLDATLAALDESGIACRPTSGWAWTDRRVSLLDPGGNRVELKQEWRRGVFPAPGERPLDTASQAPDSRVRDSGGGCR